MALSAACGIRPVLSARVLENNHDTRRCLPVGPPGKRLHYDELSDLGQPDVNIGPNTACGENARKRACICSPFGPTLASVCGERFPGRIASLDPLCFGSPRQQRPLYPAGSPVYVRGGGPGPHAGEKSQRDCSGRLFLHAVGRTIILIASRQPMSRYLGANR